MPPPETFWPRVYLPNANKVLKSSFALQSNIGIAFISKCDSKARHRLCFNSNFTSLTIFGILLLVSRDFFCLNCFRSFDCVTAVGVGGNGGQRRRRWWRGVVCPFPFGNGCATCDPLTRVCHSCFFWLFPIRGYLSCVLVGYVSINLSSHHHFSTRINRMNTLKPWVAGDGWFWSPSNNSHEHVS